jgi:hypothetical protein
VPPRKVTKSRRLMEPLELQERQLPPERYHTRPWQLNDWLLACLPYAGFGSFASFGHLLGESGEPSLADVCGRSEDRINRCERRRISRSGLMGKF